LEDTMTGRIHAIVAAFCLLAATSFSAQAEPRVALVIGNSNYGSDIGKLANPANDAGLMARALEQTGFKVIRITDADQKKMKRAIADFGDQLSAAGPQATGLFYYAGHGVQVQGQNYLVPVGADIAKEADVDIESVSAEDVMKQMDFAANAVNIIILDACRNNPLQRSFRSATRGLAPMRSDSVRGTFIAYSTSPGQTAADGAGANSPYSAALASAIVQPGTGIEEIFRDVRGKVMKATQDKQIPWDSSSLTAPFFFKPSQFNTASQTTEAPASKPAANAAPASLELEKTMWDGIKDSKQPGDYQAYLDQYPDGVFAQIAKSRMASLGTGAPREQTIAPAVQPVTAAQPAPEPAPAPEPVEVSTTAAPEAEAVTAEPAAILRDSRGVDCKVKDLSRSNSDLALCKSVIGGGGGGGGGSGGSRSTGSQGWK
jgi:carboxyl-terminal processing protease